MNKMLELVEWLADYAEVEVKGIQDIGRLSYRLRGLIQFKDADRLDAWKERMDQCVVNEFSNPQPIKQEWPYALDEEEDMTYPPMEEPVHWVFIDENGFEYHEEEA